MMAITPLEIPIPLNHHDKEIYLKLASIKKNVKGLKGIYSFDKISGCKNWLNLIELEAP